MTDAYERIWMMNGWEVGDGSWAVTDQAEPDDIEYIRADAVQAMIAEAVAKEREAAAKIADDYHKNAIEWARTVRGLERLVAETDSSRIAAAIRARKGDAT